MRGPATNEGVLPESEVIRQPRELTASTKRALGYAGHNARVSVAAYIADDGIYVIEDIQTAYWLEYGGRWRKGDTAYTTIAFLKALVDGLNYEYIPQRKPSRLDRTIEGISFYHNIASVFNGRNAHTLPRHTIRHIERSEAWQASAAVDDFN